MKLMTKEIEKIAQEQYKLGASLSQKVVAKFFDPQGAYTWYLMNQDPDDPDYLWGIVRGHEVEMGSFSLSELEAYKGHLGLGIERDLYFTPMPASEVFEKLNAGVHI